MGILAQLDWPSSATWGVFALMAAVAVAAQTHGHVRSGFHRWRLARRLARTPFMLREERRDYDYAIGDALDPLDPPVVVRRALLAGALGAIPLWLAERNLENFWDYGHWTFFGATLLYGVWRWLNDPPEPRDEGIAASVYVPREAVIGFGSAIVVVLLIMAAVFALF